MNVKIFEEQYAQAARNILLKSYHTKITICRIAEEVGVSESTLKRAFKNCFNIGVYEFQVMLRMEKAKEYLLEGGKSIKYVTRQVGARLFFIFIWFNGRLNGYGALTKRQVSINY